MALDLKGICISIGVPMSFTLCPACRLPTERAFSALPCEECLSSLLFSPVICPICLGFACAEDSRTCTRDWIRVDGAEDAPVRFTRLIAGYLSLGPGFRVLKAWKTTRNPALERILLAGVRNALRPFEQSEDLTLVPIPQSPARRWELFGGSTLRLCEMVRAVRKESGLRATVLEALQVAPASGELHETSQARTRGADRYRRSSPFVRDETIGPDSVEASPLLLVDDFLTSGSTLRKALHSLRIDRSGRPSPFAHQDFHAFVLGFRPTFSTETGA
jgi:predicted amidophosphoribosyltransferase